MTDNNQNKQHWLVRPGTIRGLWWGGSAILAVTVALQWVVKVKGYVGIDDWPAFGAVFGFFSCVAMVLVAKVLGAVLKRPEDYYAEPAELANSESKPSTGGAPDA